MLSRRTRPRPGRAGVPGGGAPAEARATLARASACSTWGVIIDAAAWTWPRPHVPMPLAGLGLPAPHSGPGEQRGARPVGGRPCPPLAARCALVLRARCCGGGAVLAPSPVLYPPWAPHRRLCEMPLAKYTLRTHPRRVRHQPASLGMALPPAGAMQRTPGTSKALAANGGRSLRRMMCRRCGARPPGLADAASRTPCANRSMATPFTCDLCFSVSG